jgi:maleylpyruvate isomerase
LTTTLYDFFRSGTSHRLRIALNLKGLTYDRVFVNLRQEEHLAEAYRSINPQRLVPALVEQGHVLTQTPAIIEWLDEQYPHPPFLPDDPFARAHLRALASLVGCDIHPLNNRRVLEYLRGQFAADQAMINRWCTEWIVAGFDAYEALLASTPPSAPFSHGREPMLADIYLIPQIESARRFGVDLNRWPRLISIEAACLQIEAFRRAAPMAQPDAK